MANTKIPAELSSTPGIVDNSNATAITIDSNEFVGIGTSPSATLHVASSSSKIAEFERIGNQVFDLTISDVGEGVGQLWFNAQTNDTGFNFRPKSSGGTNTNALYIAPDGDIGIGTTNPTEKLEVDGGVKISNSNSRLYFGTAGGTSYRALEGNTTGSLLQVGEGYTDIALQGNVGIGTTSPQHDLVIHNDSGPFLSLIGDGYNDEMGIIFNGGDLANASSAGNTGAKITSQLSVTGGQVLGDLRFTTNSGDTFVDAMRIDSDGNVGIGISSPSSYANDDNSLAVLGQVRIQGVTNTAAAPILALRDNNSGLFAPASNIVSISAGASEKMFVTGSGRVHIGHTTRTGWDSLGTVVVQQAAAGAGIGIVDEGGNNTLKIENNNTEAKINHNSAAANVEIGTGGSGHLYIEGSTGNVGVGIANPVAGLDVKGGGGTGVTMHSYLYAGNMGIRVHGEEAALDLAGKDDGNHASSILLRNTNEGFAIVNVPADNTLRVRSFDTTNDGFYIHQTNSGANNLVDGLVMHKAGQITTPNQPSFDVHTPSNTTGVIVYPSGNINLNRGSCYNATNGRFTAPVAGVYLFYTNFIKANLATTTCRRRFNKNGSALYSGRHIRLGGEGDNNYDWGSLQVVVSLAVNDYINVDQHQGTSYGAEYDSFGGYLIG